MIDDTLPKTHLKRQKNMKKTNALVALVAYQWLIFQPFWKSFLVERKVLFLPHWLRFQGGSIPNGLMLEYVGVYIYIYINIQICNHH